MYINCNDYELLYLINEGNEKALKLLFDKYDHLIRMLAKEYAPYGNRSADLAQEFRMILYKCIECYKEEYDISFYSYFLISINRRAKRIISNDYYKESIILNELCLSYLDNSNGINIPNRHIEKLIKDNYKDKLSLDIIYECIIGGKPIKKYALDNNLNYPNLYYKYKKICSDVKALIKKYYNLT